MAPYLQDIQATRAFLKQNFDGPEVVKALRFRLQTHLKDPKADPLSNQVWPAYQYLPELLIEPFTLLDAGCMSGFLYHFLKRHFTQCTYIGMDRWPEALEVGREFAPEVSFIQGDFMTDAIATYDYIVCSNIPFKPGEDELAIRKLSACVTRGVIMIYPNSEMRIFGPNSTPTVS